MHISGEEHFGAFSVSIWVSMSDVGRQNLVVVCVISGYQDESVVWEGAYMSVVGNHCLVFGIARDRDQYNIFLQ